MRHQPQFDAPRQGSIKNNPQICFCLTPFLDFVEYFIAFSKQNEIKKTHQNRQKDNHFLQSTLYNMNKAIVAVALFA